MKAEIGGKMKKKPRDPKVEIDFSIRFFPWWATPAIGVTLVVIVVTWKVLDVLL